MPLLTRSLLIWLPASLQMNQSVTFEFDRCGARSYGWACCWPSYQPYVPSSALNSATKQTQTPATVALAEKCLTKSTCWPHSPCWEPLLSYHEAQRRTIVDADTGRSISKEEAGPQGRNRLQCLVFHRTFGNAAGLASHMSTHKGTRCKRQPTIAQSFRAAVKQHDPAGDKNKIEVTLCW